MRGESDLDVPERVALVDAAVALDGGSVRLEVLDPEARTRTVELPQHVLEPFPPDRIPGRLHLDGRPIPLRSEAERRLVAALAAAAVDPDPARGPGDASLARELAEQVVETVRSPAYLEVARRFEPDPESDGRESA